MYTVIEAVRVKKDVSECRLFDAVQDHSVRVDQVWHTSKHKVAQGISAYVAANEAEDNRWMARRCVATRGPVDCHTEGVIAARGPAGIIAARSPAGIIAARSPAGEPRADIVADQVFRISNTKWRKASRQM